MRNQMKVKEILMGHGQGEQVCLNILFEILAHRTWKGWVSSCRPSQLNYQIGLVWPQGASMALQPPLC